MTNALTSLHHICIVVHDVEKTAAYYTSIGIGPWQDYPPFSTSAFAELDPPDLAAFTGLKFKFVKLGALELQICQPNEENGPHRSFLDTHGEGVFYLGFDVPDCDAAEKVGFAQGLAPLMRGRRADGSGFSFFDTAREAGVVLEIRSNPAPSAKA